VARDQDQRKARAVKGMGDRGSPGCSPPPWVEDWQPPKPKTYVGFPPIMFLRLAEHASKTRYVSGPELAFAIEKNPGVALSDELRQYLCRLLRGQVERAPRGRTNNERFNDTVQSMILRDYELFRREESQKRKEGQKREVNQKRKASGSGKPRGEPPAHVAIERLKKKYPRHLKAAPASIPNKLTELRNAGFGRPENYGVRRKRRPA
jgi:hypothetical protein